MTKEIENSILEIAQLSRAASRKLSGMCKASKNDALQNSVNNFMCKQTVST